MRSVINIVVALIVAAFGYGAWLRHEDDLRRDADIRHVRTAVQDLSREIKLHAALNKSELNGRGWPVTIDPVWFNSQPPDNILLDDERPWLEVAPPEHAHLVHPLVRIAVHRSVAAFWYNPANGVVRARAPMSLSDKRSTEVYNEINGTSLASIFSEIVPPHADPLRGALTQTADADAETDDAESTEMGPEAPEDMTVEALDPTAPPGESGDQAGDPSGDAAPASEAAPGESGGDSGSASGGESGGDSGGELGGDVAPAPSPAPSTETSA